MTLSAPLPGPCTLQSSGNLIGYPVRLAVAWDKICETEGQRERLHSGNLIGYRMPLGIPEEKWSQ
jgi:hypothetical protein